MENKIINTENKTSKTGLFPAIKKVTPAIVLACALLLSGCTGKTGKVATNIDTSTGELLSQDNNGIDEDVIKNIKDYVKNAPSVSNIILSENFQKYNLEEEIAKRKNSFVFASEKEKVASTDKVNVTFIDVTLSSGKSTYEINVSYDFDLNQNYDASFKNGIVNQAIGEKVVIENCKMPDGSVAKVKLKINYVTRKVDNLNALDSLVPEGYENYTSWLESALDKASKVNDIWAQLLKSVTVETTSEEFKKYFNDKYNNAYEYFASYGQTVDEAALKASIETQCKKEFIAYYYGKEYGVDFGDFREEELENIAFYYGYTIDAFKAKYSESVLENTVFMDLVGAEILEQLEK